MLLDLPRKLLAKKSKARFLLMEMDFDAEIDAALDALSDCSYEELGDIDIATEEVLLIPAENATEDNTDWMKLFLERTCEQSKKIEDGLCDAEMVLAEINKTVNECHSARLAITDGQSSSDICLDICEDENVVSQSTPNGYFDEDKNFRGAISTTEPADISTQSDNIEIVDEFHIQKQEADQRILCVETSYSEEIAHRIDDIEAKRVATAQHLQEMENAEREILMELHRQKEFYTKERNNNAACMIQSCYRRYVVRKQYGDLLDERLCQLKEARTRARILAIEEKRRETKENASEKTNGKETEKHDEQTLKEKAAFLTHDNSEFVTNNLVIRTNDEEPSHRLNFTDARPETASDDNMSASIDNNFLDNDKFSANLTSKTEQKEGDEITFENSIHSINDMRDNDSDSQHPDVTSAPSSPLLSPQPANEEASFEMPNLKEAQSSNAQLLESTSNDASVNPSLSDVNMQENDNLSLGVVAEPSKVTSDLSRNTAAVLVKDETQRERFSALKKDLALLEKSVSFEKEPSIATFTGHPAAPSLLHETNSPAQNYDVRKCFHDNIDKDLAILEAPVEFPIKISTRKSDCENAEENCAYSDHEHIEKQDGKSSQEDDSSANSVIVEEASEDARKSSCSVDQSSQDKIPDVAKLENSEPGKCENQNEPFIKKSEDSESSSESFSIQLKEKVLSREEGDIELQSTSATLKRDNNVEKILQTSDEIDQNSFFENSSPSSIDVGKKFSNDVMVKKASVPLELKSSSLVCGASQEELIAETEKEKLSSLDVVSMFSHDNPAVNVAQISASTTNKTNLLAEDSSFRKGSEILATNVRSSENISKDVAKMRQSDSPPKKSSNRFDEEKKALSLPLQTKDDVTGASKNGNARNKTKQNNLLSDNDFDESYTLTKTWKSWKNQCKKWNKGETNEITKPRFRRIIRKSSAAKKLPPLTQEEILHGKWPHYRELSKAQTFESLSRVYIGQAVGDGRNLTLLHRCSNLTHLTLFKCGLVSLEGLQACPSLRHINVSYNNVSFVSCDGMKRLESLVVAENRLTSIHGLSGCHALLLLDMSHNNITRISGLDETQNLAHLRLSHNQLLSVDGLRHINALLSLDISHNNVSTLQGIEGCGLLRYLNASNNYFTSIPACNLTSAVLLVHLDLGGNNISKTQFHAEDVVFLPSLRHLCLQRNKISLEDMEFPCRVIAPLLQNLNLCQNLISNADDLFAELGQSKCFKYLRLSENLFSKEQKFEAYEKVKNHGFNISFSEEEIFPSVPRITDTITSCLLLPAETEKDTSTPSPNEENYFRGIIEQINDYVDLLSVELTEVKSMLGWKNNRDEVNNLNVSKVLQLPLDAFSCHCDYLKKHFEMAIRHRFAHEEAPVSKSQTIKLMEDRKEIDTAMELSPRHAATTSTRPVSRSQHEQRITEATAESDFILGDRSAPVSKAIKSSKPFSFAIIDDKETTSPTLVQTELLHPAVRHGDSSGTRSSTNTKLVYEELQRSKIWSTMETLAACKIQNFWKRSRRTRILRNKLKRHNRAASIIQSAWRGFTVRRNIKKAFASFNTSSEIDGEDFEEVDLSQLEFDEDSYDQQWAFKTNLFRNLSSVTPTRPQSTVGLQPEPRYTPSPSLPNRPGRNTSPEEVINSQNMWQKIASMSKPPLPPITPNGNTAASQKLHVADVIKDSSSLLDSHRSKHSHQEEVLSNEWGLQSPTSTELMLKRARRMKGRRKKEVSAVEKLRRFQDRSQKVTQQPLMTQQKPTQPRNRKEYFKAREMEFEQQDKVPSEDDERRRQYTYEWLHTSANSPQSTVHASKSRGRHASPRNTTSHRSGSGKAGFLPDITQRHIGGSTHHNDMEVLSLSSFNSNQSRSKHLLKDIARRHAGNP